MNLFNTECHYQIMLIKKKSIFFYVILKHTLYLYIILCYIYLFNIYILSKYFENRNNSPTESPESYFKFLVTLSLCLFVSWSDIILSCARIFKYSLSYRIVFIVYLDKNNSIIIRNNIKIKNRQLYII